MRFFCRLIVPAAVIVALAGCEKPPMRLNAPPQGNSENPSTLQESFVYMVDNAMLEDLSMADVHFVPHLAELNGNGARRLERYAKLLTVYGGTIRYTSTRGGEALTAQRLESIGKYLATTGIAPDRVKVTEGLPGGVGMSAREAIAAKAVNIAPEGGERAGAYGSMGGRGGPLSALSGLFGGGK